MQRRRASDGPRTHAPPPLEPLSQLISVPRLLSLLTSNLQPSSKHAPLPLSHPAFSAPAPSASSRRSHAYALLLNSSLPYRYSYDGDDDATSIPPSSHSSHPPSQEECRPQENADPVPSSATAYSVRLRDEWLTFLFLLRAHGQFDRANAAQLLRSRLREQQLVTLPASLLPPSSAAAASTSVTVPFTSASAVLALLLELAGSGQTWNAVPAPLLAELRRAYEESSLSSSFVLPPPPSSTFPFDGLSSFPSADDVNADDSAWLDAQQLLSPLSDAASSSPLLEDAWSIEKRLLLSFPNTPHPHLPSPSEVWDLQELLHSPALFSFQESGAAALPHTEASLAPAAPAHSSSSFFELAVLRSAEDGVSRRRLQSKEKAERWKTNADAARFTEAWQEHRSQLMHRASSSTVAQEDDVVWQRVGSAPSPPQTTASPLLPLASYAQEDGARSPPLAYLSLFSHPDLFHRLHVGTLSSLFSPTASPSTAASLSELTQVEDDTVRCSLLVLQAIPSALYSLSPSSFEFTASGAHRFPVSFSRIVRECAEVGTQLLRLERLVEALPSDCVISRGLASALALFSSTFKQQMAEMPHVAAERRRRAAKEGPTLPLTLLELHCHLQPAQSHLAWLYRLLQRPSSALPPSAVGPSPLPSGAALLSFLYQQGLTLPPASPFFSTLTSLFQAALGPFLLRLHGLLYHGQLDEQLRQLRCVTASGSSEHADAQQLQLPVFLAEEKQALEAASAQLRLLVTGAGAEWALSCDGCGVPVLQVAYSVRDVECMGSWREELRLQQEQRLRRLEDDEARRLQDAREQRLAQRLQRAAAMSAQRGEARRMEEEQETTDKRRRQEQYQRELDAQLLEKAKRAEEERQRDEKEREVEAQRRLKEQRIIEEEKAKLLAQITAVEQGAEQRQLQRKEWRRKRLQRADSLAQLLQGEQAQWAERLQRPDEGSSTVDSPHGGVNEEEEDGLHSDDDYHTDDEGGSTRSQSPSEAKAAAGRPAPLLSSVQRRAFHFDYDSPASPSTAHSSPHFFSPSPRHAPTDTEDSDHPTLSAFRIPSPANDPSSAGDAPAAGNAQEAGGGRRFMFEAVPSPRSGLDSGATPSPALSPRQHRRVDSLSSAVTSGSERDSPRSLQQPLAPTHGSSVPELSTNAPSPANSQLELGAQLGNVEGEVKQTDGARSAVEYNWEEPFDWATAVAHEETTAGEEDDIDWTDEEEEETQPPGPNGDVSSNAKPSHSAAEAERVREQHAEGERRRALNRQRNTRSQVTFASAKETAAGEVEAAQSELIRMMAAKEAQRASNEGRGLARERNERSRLFDGADDGKEDRRDESSPLKSNRQRMMASSVFPALTIEKEKPPIQPTGAAATGLSLPLPPPAAAPVEEKAAEGDVSAAVDVLPKVEVEHTAELKNALLPPAASPQTPATLAEVDPTHRLPLDVAVRCSLLPAVHLQVAMIERATLSFCLHHLHIDSHLHSLDQFLLMKAGDLLDTFTAALFAHTKQQPAIPLTPPTLLQLWQTALELCPPPPSLLLHPSLISFSVSSSPPAPSLHRVDGMEAVDSVRMHYRVAHPASVVVSEEVVAQYGRVFNLLLRVQWVRSEMRELFLWMRAQDGDIRRREAQQRLTIQSSQAKPAATPSSSGGVRRGRALPSTDDLSVLSPTKRRPAAGPLSPSVSAARDDDVWQRQRVEVEAARRELEGLVHARWRLRWLHAVRAEMGHVLSSIHQHLHVSCIADLSSSLFAHFQPPTLTSLSHLQAVHATFLSSLLSSTFLSAPSPLASLLEAVLCTILTFAQSLSPLTLHSPLQAERWQSLRDLAAQFRGHGAFLARLLSVGREEGVAGEAVQSLEAALDYNHYYSRLRQRQLEATVLS